MGEIYTPSIGEANGGDGLSKEYTLQYYFEYRIAGSNAEPTLAPEEPIKDVRRGSTWGLPERLSVVVTGLQPQTKYEFRIVGMLAPFDQEHTLKGDWETFTTGAASASSKQQLLSKAGLNSLVYQR